MKVPSKARNTTLIISIPSSWLSLILNFVTLSGNSKAITMPFSTQSYLFLVSKRSQFTKEGKSLWFRRCAKQVHKNPYYFPSAENLKFGRRQMVTKSLTHSGSWQTVIEDLENHQCKRKGGRRHLAALCHSVAQIQSLPFICIPLRVL